ncbi:MAG: hypothetical protein SVE93_04800 [Candidatus Thermoplasmatota archaeon]|nr:hypothetical protein [Candidatus Thermoplasmatota archaeon]
MDLFAFFLGFAIAAVITFFVIYLSMRSSVPVEKSAELVSTWSAKELGLEVKGIVESAGDIDIPAGSMLVVRDSSYVPQKILDTCEVRTNPEVKGNMLIGRNRAFIFSGVMSKSALVVVTDDDDMLLKLSNQFNALWTGAVPYAEVVNIKDLRDNVGKYVKISGHVTDARPFKGNLPYSWILRVISMGVGVDVLADKEYKNDIEVVGKVREEKGATAVDSLFVKEQS